jgi:shikimate dehydrogenase
MSKNTETKYVGLIGYPLGHSISPVFQQAAFDYYALNVRYELWETEPAKLKEVVEGLRRSENIGANVTVPYKETVLPFLDELDPLAREIGAVNTIVRQGDRLVGYNTDVTGFIRALSQDGGFDPWGKRVVLLGAGGVARAASFALAKAGVQSLAITDIVAERAQGLAEDLERTMAGGPVSTPEIRAIVRSSGAGTEEAELMETLADCDLLVNCTPVGMKHSATEGQSPLEARFIPARALVYDLVYNPMETPLLADAKRMGALTLGGLSMLVYQGAASFELWTGCKAPLDVMLRAARRALEA